MNRTDLIANLHRTEPQSRGARRRHCLAVFLAGIMAATVPTAPPILAQSEIVEEGSYRRNAAGEYIGDFGNTKEQPIEMIIAIIGEQIPTPRIETFGRTSGERVKLFGQGITLEEAINQIVNQKSWIYWKMENGNYGIADRQYYEQEIVPRRFVQKVFQPKNLKASELQKAVEDLLTKGAATGSAVADDRTNKLIVNDLPIVMERIERLIREIDVALITRVFRIRHANVDDIAAKIESYKSGPGTIEVDQKTRQIIVTDLLANIKKMELLIDILDIGPEIVIYDVNNIGIDGADLESLKAIIESIRTPDLLFETNEKQGVFIIEDQPSVHEKVEQILASFDRPVKQVQIQGEIVQTTFTRSFALGIDRFAFSQDLFNAVKDGAVPLIPGVDAARSAQPDLGFTNLEKTFPAFNFSGGTISGSYLNNEVYVQASTTFTDSTTQVLLQPNLLVKNQEQSRIFVGSETPFLTTFFSGDGDNSSRSQTQQRVQDGLEFVITPSISNTFLIEMEITINNDKAFEAGVNQGITLIGRNRQNLETVLQIPSGQTRVIGGLVTTTQQESYSGVPFLSKLPILSYLLGKKSSSDQRNNLMLFITPTVVEDEIPRPSGKDGRRGRLVSDYEVLQQSLDLSPEALQRLQEELGELSEGELDASSLLSGDSGEEAELLRLLREDFPDGKGSEDPFADSNYVPTAGSGGGATLNTGGGAATGGGQQRGGGGATPVTRPPQQGGGRTPAQPPPPPQAVPEVPVVPATRETRY